ncbi:MAG: hypothetical protein Q7S16_01540 [bacterium]|nr:hypothetical protein [bacterium]
MDLEPCVVYAPEGEVLLGMPHDEIWRGIPTDVYPFVEKENRGGEPSFLVQKDGVYIWVISDALNAYRENPNILLLASGCRKKGDIRFRWVSPPPSPPWPPQDGSMKEEDVLARMIERVKKLNEKKSVEYLRLQRASKSGRQLPTAEQLQSFALFGGIAEWKKGRRLRLLHLQKGEASHLADLFRLKEASRLRITYEPRVHPDTTRVLHCFGVRRKDETLPLAKLRRLYTSPILIPEGEGGRALVRTCVEFWGKRGSEIDAELLRFLQ